MDLEFTDEQRMLRDAFLALAARFADPAGAGDAYCLDGTALDAELAASGFLGVAVAEGCGLLEAVLLIEALGRSPYPVEVMASSLLAPILPADLVRPFAVAGEPLGAPVRFLSPDATLLVDGGDAIYVAAPGSIVIAPAASHYNYAAARPVDVNLAGLRCLDGVDPAAFRARWRLGIAAELIGAMQPALDQVIDFVKQREQFGQPIGAFQAVRHRLAEAHVLVQGARLLVYQAATDGSAEAAAFALSFAQDAAARVGYEAQQFHGAIGLTLEYPLHFWTYRLKPLIGEIGGAGRQQRDAADLLWPVDRPIPDTFGGRPHPFDPMEA